MPRLPSFVLPAATLLCSPAHAEIPIPPRQINLFAEARVSIAAPCGMVWDLLLDRKSWVPGFLERTTLSGVTNHPGEVAFVRTIYRDQPNDRFEQVLVVEPRQRFMLAMMAPAAATTVFADYRMQAKR